MSTQFNAVLFKALATSAVFLTLSILGHLAGLGELPLTTLLVLPGTFLFKSFSWMAFYLPALIAVLTVALQLESFRQRVLLPIGLSVVPFFTLSALVKLYAGSDASPVTTFLLDNYGQSGSALILLILTVFEALVISGVTLAANGGKGDGPSFLQGLGSWWAGFFAEAFTGKASETRLLTADHGKTKLAKGLGPQVVLTGVKASVEPLGANLRQDPFFNEGAAASAAEAAPRPAVKTLDRSADPVRQMESLFPETSSVLKEIDALLAKNWQPPKAETPAPVKPAESLMARAVQAKQDLAVEETLAYIQSGTRSAPAAVSPAPAEALQPLAVPEPPVPPVFDEEPIVDWDRLPHAELDSEADLDSETAELEADLPTDEEDEDFDRQLDYRLQKELASQALVSRVFPLETEVEAFDSADEDDLAEADDAADNLAAIFARSQPQAQAEPDAVQRAASAFDPDEEDNSPASFDWKAMDAQLRAGQLSATINPMEGGNNVAPRMGRVIESNITKDIPFVSSAERQKFRGYHVPVEGILTAYKESTFNEIDEDTKRSAHVLKMTLKEFNIDADVTGIRKGPVVTMFEILPAAGVKLSKIVTLQDNIALGLAATSVRIVAPIPGKHAVGIEVPNKDRAIVGFAEMINSREFQETKHELPIVLGKDISGDIQIIDLAKTPHLLIAGATGSGKSVSVNTLVCSLLYKRSPDEVRLLMVDPKIVELKFFNDIPHLLAPVITEPKKALQAVQWCLYEMERRYALLDAIGAKDIKSYNAKVEKRHLATTKLPYIVLVVDEFADLMATSGKDLEGTLARLAAMSRAVGIHLVLATQRPSIDVITGLIKANFPSRIAFMVASKTDSRIIIDSMGAEKLLGRGDMLFTSSWNPFPSRIQGAFLSEDEVERVVDHVKTLGEPDYISDEIFFDDEEEVEKDTFASDEMDPLFEKALEIVRSQKKASASFLQRRLGIGYNRAARLVETMEEMGFVGPSNGSKPREIVHSV